MCPQSSVSQRQWSSIEGYEEGGDRYAKYRQLSTRNTTGELTFRSASLYYALAAFNPNKRGYLYQIESVEIDLLQFGINNVPEQRLSLCASAKAGTSSRCKVLGESVKSLTNGNNPS